jgi:hypothetical protein
MTGTVVRNQSILILIDSRADIILAFRISILYIS